MNCTVFLMATTALKWKDAICPESGISPNGMFPYHIFRLLIFSASVCKGECEGEHVHMVGTEGRYPQ